MFRHGKLILNRLAIRFIEWLDENGGIIKEYPLLSQDGYRLPSTNEAVPPGKIARQANSGD